MEHIVTIEKIIAGGRGLARPDDGKVIMTDFVLPGETVQIRHYKEFSHFIEGELLAILSSSPDRSEPVCPHYGKCGGCNLQHVDYRAQLKIKQAIVQEAMVRAGIELPENGVQETLPSPDQWEYRSRLRLKLDSKGQLGFFRKKSNRLVAVNNCPVAAPALNKVLAELQTTAVLKDIAEICEEIELLQSPDSHEVTLVLRVGGKKKPSQKRIQTIADHISIDAVGYTLQHHYFQILPQQKTKTLCQTTALPIHNTICTLCWSAGCFSQVNAGQNKQLIQLLCRLAGDVRNTTLLDLFCGMGNFSIPLALQEATVTGIEQNPLSIKWAQANAETAGVCCSFYTADVNRSLQELAEDRQHVDTILLDPPRRGLGKAAGLLPKLNPLQILYISCDPATLARDLAIICKQGYRVTELNPVDMFPQTHHIESVALLKKN
jgi:23S rRNA (uracil1939-C5)-methyltransferase